MGSEINNKINEFICNPKNVKKRRNTRLEKCYGHVNIATANNKSIQKKYKKITKIHSNKTKAKKTVCLHLYS